MRQQNSELVMVNNSASFSEFELKSAVTQPLCACQMIINFLDNPKSTAHGVISEHTPAEEAQASFSTAERKPDEK